MTFRKLVHTFLSSRGSLIILSAIVAVAIRVSLWSIQTKDWIIVGTIILLWPTLEYVFHRWVFHEWSWTPFRFTHDRHHDNPTTDTGLPDLWVIGMYFVNSILFAFTTPGIYTAHCTILVMLCMYEFIHFSCHCDYTPKTWWGWSVRINHLQHHKLNRPSRYAMSLPIIRESSKSGQAS